MSDGKVTIDVILEDGSVAKGIANLKGLGKGADGATSSLKSMVGALGLVKLASKAFDILKSSMDGAVSRFDTFNKFPKVMKALGFSTEESKKSMDKLADGIDGLPTKLDEVVGTAQRMTSVTGNLDKSTDATIALNNAMLASGASTADAARGMDQYIQMLSTGEVDLQSWKTLQETMPIGLQKTAEAMGFVGETAQRDLYQALKDGTITFDEFQDKLIELGTGTGELAELAKVNSEGIATSFSNLKNAVVKGLANTLTKIDEVVQKVSGKTIAQQLDSLKGIINGTFDVVNNSIEKVIPLIEQFQKVMEVVKDTIEQLITGDGSLESLSGLFSNIGETIGEVIADVLNRIATFIPEVIDKIVEFVPRMFETAIAIVTGFIDGFMESLPLIVEQGSALIDNLVNGIVEKFPAMWETALTTVMEFAQYIVDNAPLIIEAGVDLLLKLIDGFVKMVPSLAGAAVNAVTSLATFIINNGPTIVQKGVELLLKLIQGILNAVPKLASTAATVIGQLASYLISNFPKIVMAGVEIIISLVKGIISAIGRAVSAAGQVVRALWNAFTSVSWGEVGSNIISGIVGGISAGVGRLVSAAVNAAKSAFNAAKNFLGIHSPSRLMRDMIGKNMMIGWELGIEKNADLPADAITDVAKDVIAPPMRAEQVIGGRTMGIGTGGIYNTNSVNNSNNSYSYGGLFDGATIIWQGKDDIRRTMQEMMWVTETERGGMNA